jgi:hypothetical protein
MTLIGRLSGHWQEDRWEAAVTIERGIEGTIAAGEITRDIGGRLAARKQARP